MALSEMASALVGDCTGVSQECCVSCGVGTLSINENNCASCPDVSSAGDLYTNSQLTCEVSSCLPGYKLESGICTLCSGKEFCRDGTSFDCIGFDSQYDFLYPSNLPNGFIGSSSAHHCSCSSGHKLSLRLDQQECTVCSTQAQIGVFDYYPQFNSALQDFPKTAQFGFECNVECIFGNTGKFCEEKCNLDPICSDLNSLVPCSTPWQAYCMECTNFVDLTSSTRILHLSQIETRKEGFERIDEYYNITWLQIQGMSHTTTTSLFGSSIQQEVRRNMGARGSQGWLEINKNTSLLSLYQTHPLSMISYYIKNDDDVWSLKINEWDSRGLQFTEKKSIDELQAHTALTQFYVDFANGSCLAGMFRHNGNCKPCVSSYFCPGKLFSHISTGIYPCPSESRSPPGSNQCICAPRKKHVISHLASSHELTSSCDFCSAAEDCMLGYTVGTLVSFQDYTKETVSLLSEYSNYLSYGDLQKLSCGPLLCCAVTEKLYGGIPQNVILCWGNNEKNRLGSNIETEFAFFSASQPVKNLATRIVSVSVSQEINPQNEHMSCALLEDGTVQCWGSNSQCDTVKYFTTTRNQKIACGYRSDSSVAVQVRTASATACARTNLNELWCWGEYITMFGRSSLAARWDTKFFRDAQDYQVSDLKDFILGDAFLCGLYVDNLICYFFTDRQFGITIATHVVSIASSAKHFCAHVAQDENHKIKCWGQFINADDTYQFSGLTTLELDQIQDPANSSQYLNLPEQFSLHVGFATVCLILKESKNNTFLLKGAVYCHGDSVTGLFNSQEEDGSVMDKIMPTVFTGSSSTGELALGRHHACFLNYEAGTHEAGMVACVGAGTHGLLGVDSCLNSNSSNVEFIPLKDLDVYFGNDAAKWQHLHKQNSSTDKSSLSNNTLTLHVGELLTHRLHINTKDSVWIKVTLNVSCHDCQVAVAKNVKGNFLQSFTNNINDVSNSVELADEIFFLKSELDFETQPSAYVWAKNGDTLAIFSLDNSVNIFNVYSYIDNDACMYECKNFFYMRNNECQRCNGNCNNDERKTTCSSAQLNPQNLCQPCELKPLNSIYIASEGNCAWQCNSSYFLNAIGECQLHRVEPCSVGKYLTVGNFEQDKTCRPCEELFTKHVYTSGGTDSSDSCDKKCISSHFIKNDLCLPCNTGTCGEGLNNERFVFNGFSVTQGCTEFSDSECKSCVGPEDIVMTAGGSFTCDYECKSGLFPQPQCGVWDEHGDVHITSDMANVENKEEATLVLSNHSVKTDTFVYNILQMPNASFVFLLKGRIKLQATSFLSSVLVEVSENYRNVTTIFLKKTITARVYSGPISQGSFDLNDVNDDDVNVWQNFEIIWSRTGFVDHDQWTFQTVRFLAQETEFDLSGVKLQAQMQQSCNLSAYACASCENFYDLTMIPDNASYLVSQDCLWSCDVNYELRNGTCLFCPELLCNTGFYMQDCGICAPCQSDDVNILWLSAGLKNEAMSCESTCPLNFFRQNDMTICQQCNLNLTCESDFFLSSCNARENSECLLCSRCSEGFVTAAVCSNVTDTKCVPCVANGSTTGLLPNLATWVESRLTGDFYAYLPECSWECGQGSFHDPLLGICKYCDETCEIGQYHTTCIAETNFRGCMPCDIPENAIATSVGRNFPDSCAWECQDQTTLIILTSGLFACQAIATPAPPVVVAPCVLNRRDCEFGQYFQASTCDCLACTPLLNTSLIARFTSRGSCAWNCVYPFIRTQMYCDRLTLTSISSGQTNSTLLVSGPQIGFIVLTILPFMIILSVASYGLFK